MERHLPNKSLNDFASKEDVHLKCWFGHSEMPEPMSVITMIWYNEVSCMVAFPNTR